MAGRPQKFTVDYFSHDANASSGKTLSILFNQFGHEGISAWWQLLETISSTNNHIIDIRNSEEREYLAAKMHFSAEVLDQILNKMAELNAIDKELYSSGFIWCQNFVDRLIPVYKTRGQEIPRKPDINVKRIVISDKRKSINSPDNTQTKGTKERDYTKEIYILLPEFINQETWEAFLDMRRKKRVFPTEKAQELLIKELEKLKNQGHDPNEVLNQSIMRNYTGVFPLSDKGGQSGADRRSPRALPKTYTRPEDLR